MNRNLRESLAGGRYSPSLSQHRRGQSLNGVSRDSDENLDLFSRSRRSLPLSSSTESTDVSAKLGRLSVGSIKLPKSGADDLLASADGGKHDYDWLLTPPGTPLGNESHPPMVASKTSSLVRSVSTAKTSRLSVSQSETGHHTSRPTRSSSVTRPSVSNSHYTSYSSNRTPSSILNTSSASVSSYIRPSSPSTRSSSSSTRPSTPSRTTSSRSSTPSRTRSGSTTSTLDRTKPTQNSRPSTPTFRPQLSSATVPRSSSRSSTPTRRSPVVPSVSTTSGLNSVSGWAVSNGRTAAPLSRPNSPGARVRQPQQQPIVHPDFPHDTPPNLRTTLPGRAVSAGRSRPGAAVGIKGSPDPKSSVNLPRRNPSPITTRGRLTDAPSRGRASGNGHIVDGPESRKVSNVSDITSRRPLKPSTGLSESAGLGRSISKNSLDMALRHMDIRNGKGNPRTLSSTTLFPQSIRSATSKIQGIRNSSDSINSNGSLQSGDTSENGSNEKYMENGNRADNNGRFLAKLSDVDIYESSRYDALLLKEDVKNTNWLHSIDDKSDQSLLFDNGFESLPEPFAPQ